MGTEERNNGIPLTKLGDWGLARLTQANDLNNPTTLQLAGTAAYRPPVSITFTHARAAVAERHQEQRKSPLAIFESHPASILAHTNVWAIGATVFEVMTLHRVYGFLLKTRGNIIDEEGVKPIQTHRKPPYSSQLSQLIQDCLKPVPLDRPDILELRAKIGAHRDAIVKPQEREGAETAKPLEDERLYYVGNEIKWAKTGDWQLQKRDKDSNQSEDGFADPDFSPIRYLISKEPGE